jgi:hypothetical protein
MPQSVAAPGCTPAHPSARPRRSIFASPHAATKAVAASAHSGGRCVHPAQAKRRKPFARVQVRRPHVRFASRTSTSSHHRTQARNTRQSTSRIPTNAIRDTTTRPRRSADAHHPTDLQPILPHVQPIHQPIHKHAQLPATSHRLSPAAIFSIFMFAIFKPNGHAWGNPPFILFQINFFSESEN